MLRLFPAIAGHFFATIADVTNPPASAPAAPAIPAIPAPASTPAHIPSIPVIPPAQASAHLQQRLTTRWDDFCAAIRDSHFYIELAMIVIAFVLGMAIAKYLSQRIRARLAASPPKFIDPEFLTKPLHLLAPTLTILLLGVVQAFVQGLDIGGGLTRGILEIAYAWWLTTCVMLAVRQKPVAYTLSVVIFINALLHAARIFYAVSGYLDSISFDIGAYHITGLHIVHAAILFIVMFWGAGLISRTFESYLRRSTRMSLTTLALSVKVFRTTAYVCAFAITLSVLGIDLTAFAIFTGALGVGIGLGLQKLTSNFVSGLTVMMERSIKIGDLIDVSGSSGWVRQLNMRYILLETADGREVLIPNEELVSSRVVNWTLSTTSVRIEIPVTVAFESDARKVSELLLAAAGENPRCLRDPAPSCWLTEFKDNGFGFTLAFWISDVKEGRNGPKSDVMFTILDKFRQNGITLAHG